MCASLYLLLSTFAATTLAFTSVPSFSRITRTSFGSSSVRRTLEKSESSCDMKWNLHKIDRLSDWLPKGNANMLNPLLTNDKMRSRFVRESEAVVKCVVVDTAAKSNPQVEHCFVRAGPREKIFFNPNEVKAAVVTCGGLCPGLNTVIREVVHCLSNQYGVQSVYGVHGGYRGFYDNKVEWEKLSPKSVDQIHTLGGSMLGTSRGGHDTTKIVDALEAKGINMVFIVGGDGTMHGASKIAVEGKRRGLKLSVMGIPKTVDNDIPFIDKSFGFESAVEESQRAIRSAHVEASSFPNGVGIVQLMGRK
jgi:6-phosphofructokinase 1